MVNTTYESTENFNNKLYSLKVKIKLKFYQNVSNYYKELKVTRRSNVFQFKEDPLVKMPQALVKIIMK